MQKRHAMISCSVLQQMSCFGSAKVLGGRLQNPKCPFQGGRSGLWGDDVEKRLSAGSCIPCQAGHWVLQRHFPSRPFSGPVNSPPVLVTSSRASPASEHHRPGESGDRKYQCEVLPVSIALYYKISNMPGGVRWSLRSGKPVLLAFPANGSGNTLLLNAGPPPPVHDPLRKGMLAPRIWFSNSWDTRLKSHSKSQQDQEDMIPAAK